MNRSEQLENLRTKYRQLREDIDQYFGSIQSSLHDMELIAQHINDSRQSKSVGDGDLRRSQLMPNSDQAMSLLKDKVAVQDVNLSTIIDQMTFIRKESLDDKSFLIQCLMESQSHLLDIKRMKLTITTGSKPVVRTNDGSDHVSSTTTTTTATTITNPLNYH